MKRKVAAILLVLFPLCNSIVYADDFMSSPSMDTFSMDMIMNQGQMAMESGNDAINDADLTNNMNNEMDLSSIDFFFNDSALSLNNVDDITNAGIEIQDAFLNGNWSEPFEQYFNSNNDMIFPELSYSNDQSSQNSPNSEDNFLNNDMPELSYADNESITDLNSSMDNSFFDGVLNNTTMFDEELQQYMVEDADSSNDINETQEDELKSRDQLNLNSFTVSNVIDSLNKTEDTNNNDNTLQNQNSDDANKNTIPLDTQNNNNNNNNDD